MALNNNINSLKKELEKIKNDVLKTDTGNSLLEGMSQEHQDRLSEFTSCVADTLEDSQIEELQHICSSYGLSIAYNRAKYWPAECRWLITLTQKELEEIESIEEYEEEFNKYLEHRRAN